MAQEGSAIDSMSLNDLVELSDKNLYDNPALSLDYAIAADSIAQKLNNDSIRASTLNRIGSAHWSLGNQLKALQSIQSSLQISEPNNYQSITALNFNTIGHIYRSSGLSLDAVGYYRSALSMIDESGSQDKKVEMLNNIGGAFLDVSFYDSAKKYLSKGASLLSKENEAIHFYLYYNLALNEFESGRIEKAKTMLDKALYNAIQNKSKSGIIIGNRLKAEFLRQSGEPRKALEYALKATAIAENSNIKELIYQCNKTLSNCYGDLNIYEEAYKTYRAYETYRDSVFNNNIKNELELLSYYERLFRYRVLESESIVNRQLAEERERTIYGLAFILIFIFGLLFVIFMVIRQLNKQKKELEELNNFKSKVLAIVSHDIKYPMQEVVGVIDLFNHKLVSEEEITLVLPEIKQKTENLIELITNLLQWAEGQMDTKSIEKNEFSLLKLLESIQSDLDGRLKEKNLELELPATDFKIRSNSIILKIILRNLITNAIKFSFEGSKIEISRVIGDYSIKILVKDHGVGMSEELLESLFKNKVASSTGTSGEIGSGIGLTICNDFVKRLGGIFHAKSKPGLGSTFTVELPLH